MTSMPLLLSKFGDSFIAWHGTWKPSSSWFVFGISLVFERTCGCGWEWDAKKKKMVLLI